MPETNVFFSWRVWSLRFLLLIFCMGALWGCRSGRKGGGAAPPPAARYEQVDTAPLLSVVGARIELPISSLARFVNEQTAEVLYEDKFSKTGLEQVYLRVDKREPIQLYGRADELHITVPLSIRAEAAALGIRQALSFALDLYFATHLQFKPNWEAVAKTRPAGFKWVRKPVFNFAGFSFSLEKEISRLIESQQVNLASLLDEEIAQNIKLREYVQPAWEAIGDVFELSQEYNTWLVCEPLGIAISPIEMRPYAIETSLSLQLRTHTWVGQRPAKPKPRPLPALEPLPSKQNNFEIHLPVGISLIDATRMLRAQYIGETFSSGRRSVQVRDISLYGNNQDLIIQLELLGSYNGKIFLRGKPKYDPQRQEVYLAELDFDLKTRNFLLKTADWLLHSALRKRMGQYTRFSLRDQLEQAQQEANKWLAGQSLHEMLWLQGKLNELYPADIFITPEHLLVNFTAKGVLHMQLRL